MALFSDRSDIYNKFKLLIDFSKIFSFFVKFYRAVPRAAFCVPRSACYVNEKSKNREGKWGQKKLKSSILITIKSRASFSNANLNLFVCLFVCLFVGISTHRQRWSKPMTLSNSKSMHLILNKLFLKHVVHSKFA